MRRPNHASRSSASMVVGAGSSGDRRGRGGLNGAASPETTMRPAGGGGGNDTNTLEGIEREVESLRKAIEAEQNEIAMLQSGLNDLFGRNACEEYLNKLERRIQTIENKHIESAQWRVQNVEEVRSKLKKGEFLASPEFSACGLTGFRFHLYPRGDDFAEEGYCSLYFHVPNDTVVSRTLYMGRAQDGPVEADSLKNCGVSEMAVLSNQIDKETGSVIIGVSNLVVLKSPHVVESRTKIELVSN
eukprot:TRINITY_DN69823_c0_g1_i1.p1 TRINITY_DN69823_c0_g1~~TRINITY_DN69823_c0_g1_i1.p1  ORF type:complete len:244 (-),score=44.88 TRINITY_DN69823_c0_g1_i1:139-870(-)